MYAEFLERNPLECCWTTMASGLQVCRIAKPKLRSIAGLKIETPLNAMPGNDLRAGAEGFGVEQQVRNAKWQDPCNACLEPMDVWPEWPWTFTVMPLSTSDGCRRVSLGAHEWIVALVLNPWVLWRRTGVVSKTASHWRWRG